LLRFFFSHLPCPCSKFSLSTFLILNYMKRGPLLHVSLMSPLLLHASHHVALFGYEQIEFHDEEIDDKRSREKKYIWTFPSPPCLFFFGRKLITYECHASLGFLVCVCVDQKVYIPSPFDVFRGSQRSRTTFFFFFHHRFCCCWSSFDYILPFLCGVCVSINISVSSLL
jgi:hypothetical protein